MKLKDLKQFLSLIKDDEIEVCVGIGDKIDYLEVIEKNRGDLLLTNKGYMQTDTHEHNVKTVFKLNSK